MKQIENVMFWERVKSLLSAHKVSQRELAAYIGVSRRTFEGWIFQKRLPDAAKTCYISEALGVTVEYLFRGKEDENLGKRLKETEERKTAAANMDKLIFRMAMENSKLFGAAQLKYTAIKGIPAFFDIEKGRVNSEQ